MLHIRPERGLEIILPKRVPRHLNIPTILDEKRKWIERTWHRIMSAADRKEDPAPVTLPDSIHLQALEKTWKIIYSPSSLSKRIRLTHIENPEFNTLLLQGNTDDIPKCILILKKWLIKTATETLIPWINQLSLETELFYEHISIRGQSTLWGSCTHKRKINLNYKLLFFPKILAQHVLLHELCHLKHLNHSKSFWKLLNKWDPDSVANNKLLKAAEQYVPQWVSVKKCHVL